MNPPNVISVGCKLGEGKEVEAEAAATTVVVEDASLPEEEVEEEAVDAVAIFTLVLIPQTNGRRCPTKTNNVLEMAVLPLLQVNSNNSKLDHLNAPLLLLLMKVPMIPFRQ